MTALPPNLFPPFGRAYSCDSVLPIGISMRTLLFRFMAFIAVLWGLEQINLPTLILGIGILMTVVSAMHVLVTPENDY